MIRQVSVFIQNREGRLSEMLKVLKAEDVNIRSLTIAETADWNSLWKIVVSINI